MYVYVVALGLDLIRWRTPWDDGHLTFKLVARLRQLPIWCITPATITATTALDILPRRRLSTTSIYAQGDTKLRNNTYRMNIRSLLRHTASESQASRLIGRRCYPACVDKWLIFAPDHFIMPLTTIKFWPGLSLRQMIKLLWNNSRGHKGCCVRVPGSESPLQRIRRPADITSRWQVPVPSRMNARWRQVHRYGTIFERPG